MLNETYQEIEFMWNGQLRPKMFQDEMSKQLIFEITANVPRFETELNLFAHRENSKDFEKPQILILRRPIYI